MTEIWQQALFLWANLPSLLNGVLTTLQLSILMLGLGFAVGIPLALLENYGPSLLRIAVVLPLITFFRGVPTLVLLFLAFFGIPRLGIEISGLTASVLAIGMRSGIYQSQLLRGAILSVPQGQMLAARAIGMTKWQAIRYVVMPQMFRISIPSYANESAVVLKESSLAYALGVTELMRQGRYIVARTFDNSLAVYIACAAIYFVLVFGVSKLLAFIERRTALPGFETAHRSNTEEVR